MIFVRRGIVSMIIHRFEATSSPSVSDWSPGPRSGRAADGRAASLELIEWYEVQDPIEYWELFSKPEDSLSGYYMASSFCLDDGGTLTNNTVYFIPTSDLWVLSALNSPSDGGSPGERLSTAKTRPLATPTRSLRLTRSLARRRAIALSASRRPVPARRDHEAGNRRPSRSDRLAQSRALGQSADGRASVCLGLDARRLRDRSPEGEGQEEPLEPRGPEEPAGRALPDHPPCPGPGREALALERKISDLVNEAYGLTPEEVELMWETAPPRMPVSQRPSESGRALS